MKIIRGSLALLALGSFAARAELARAQGADTAIIKVSLDRPDWRYHVGDSARFTISATRGGRPIPVRANVALGPERMKPIWRDSIDLATGPKTVAGAITQPGFLRATVTAVIDGKTVTGLGTAAFDPERITATTTAPPDLMEFWRKAIADARKVPLAPVMTRLPERSTPEVDVYHISFQNQRVNSRIYGMLSVPTKPGKYPAILVVPGAGVRPYFPSVATAKAGIIHLAIGIHGIPVDRDSLLYNELRATALDRYYTFGVDNKDTYYYKRVYVATVRAGDFIFSLPQFDGQNYAVEGGSQGGGLSLVVAALDPRVKAISVSYPAMSDEFGYFAGHAGGWPHILQDTVGLKALPEKLETLRYYDAVNFARLVRVPGIYTFGFNDNTVPPTSSYATFNAITAPKELITVPETGHYRTPAQTEAMRAWLFKRLGVGDVDAGGFPDAMIIPPISRNAMMRSSIRLLAIATLVVAHEAQSQAPRRDTTDHWQWLEDMNGEKAMTWVKAENAKTMAVLEKDPRYTDIYKEALRMAQAKDRIPYVSFIGGELYNFWQDSAHTRGIWRKTTLASYRTKSPAWTTVLDLDTLAAKEKANWVWHGANCARPAQRRCLLNLSDGGEDANTVREFDLPSRSFVANGFMLPKGKQNVSWAGEDTLLVAREWNAGELTASGYPYIVKRLARGQPLDAATEIFRGDKKDVSVTGYTMTDGPKRVALISRGVSFFESDNYLILPSGVVQLNVPKKFEVQDYFDGQIIARLTMDWTAGGTTFKSGAVVSFSADAAARDPKNLQPTLIFEPGPRESVSSVNTTKTHLLIGIYSNVRGRVLDFTRAKDGRWTKRAIALPDNMSTDLASSDDRSEQLFINVTGFLTPSSVYLADAAAGTATPVKSLPSKFDAASSAVEQLEATSKDGTKIPYFVVHPKNMKRDGSNPTILYSYGGFEVSLTPSYSEYLGKLWLERGGVYVLANIRGGGEFGPAWHDAGLKTNRQRIYDDFAAVAQDLVARKITTPRRLGIEGGSNGGLLMGVQLTQRPDLWNAVDIQVPLLDMLRYEQIQAGASWVGEYGSVSIPAERAFLESISPYHNLQAGVKYPTPLVWTTTKDDRVGPQHARKFAAKMGEMGLPYLFYEVIEGGHGSGANIEQRARTNAMEYTYFARQLMDPPKVVP